MELSCVVCGRPLPPWHEHAPSAVDFCSLRCAEESGATLAQIREFMRLREAHTPTMPTPKS